MPANSNEPSVRITSTPTKNGVDVYFFDNGLNMQVVLNNLAANNLSWLSFGLSLDNSIRDYTNAVDGLMGNFDGDSTNDIRYSNGTVLSGVSDESLTYNASYSC